ncbi:uncharacterized protein N7496_010448 [Penicillium cataractarum]|uniref:Uncharacterized protein n=1 Tax=Penicillium cataractarum TaxID=2100454 RepID=A0A9W9V341_9EURO|nr:uncharacterized protein N7496_010448 [Penicillium cataractarum]KAJ5364735.1 hypothetical protein N7496_010448 [Penicillium cataractarum]
MHFTKLIALALAAIAPIAVAAPFQLEERQSNSCQQALAALAGTVAYYKGVTKTWTGNAATAANTEIKKLEKAGQSIKTACSQMDQAISSADQSYKQTESHNSNVWG